MSKHRVGKVCSGPEKKRLSVLRQRAESGRKGGGCGTSPTRRGRRGKTGDSLRVDPGARSRGRPIPADPGMRSIARGTVIYLNRKMKTPRYGAPLMLNIEMNIVETGINPKTADELHR